MHEVQYWSGNCCHAGNPTAQRIEISPTSTAKSNLDIFRLFLKHWIRLIQGYNYASQSMWDSQRAEIDPGGGRITTRWTVTQRSEPPQPRLLGQTLIFFNYFESIEFSSIRATIMPPKVCEVVNAHRLIRAGEGDDRRGTDQPAQWTSPTPIPGSNLDIFQLFWQHWIQLIQSYNYVFQSMWGSQRA